MISVRRGVVLRFRCGGVVYLYCFGIEGIATAFYLLWHWMIYDVDFSVLADLVVCKYYDYIDRSSSPVLAETLWSLLLMSNIQKIRSAYRLELREEASINNVISGPREYVSFLTSKRSVVIPFSPDRGPQQHGLDISRSHPPTLSVLMEARLSPALGPGCSGIDVHVLCTLH